MSKTTVLKFNPASIYEGIFYGWLAFDNEYELSTWEVEDVRHKPDLCGKVTLSIKVGNKRKLFKGFVRMEAEYGQRGEYRRYWFRPNNREKFANLINPKAKIWNGTS
jgi:hypothetical protein